MIMGCSKAYFIVPNIRLKFNIKIRVWTVLWTIIRKARNHCQDVDKRGDEDHCQYHLVIDHCQTGNHCRDREHCQNGNVQINDQDQWSVLKYNLIIS